MAVPRGDKRLLLLDASGASLLDMSPRTISAILWPDECDVLGDDGATAVDVLEDDGGGKWRMPAAVTVHTDQDDGRDHNVPRLGASLTTERVVTVGAMLEVAKQDVPYCRVLTVGRDARVLDLDEEVQFGQTYQLVRTQCPPCTLCDTCCTRGAMPHLLCAHLSGNDSMHLWHDVARRVYSIQGYLNGCGLETEFTDDEIFREMKVIVLEAMDGASSEKTWFDLLAHFSRLATKAPHPTVRVAIAKALGAVQPYDGKSVG